MRQSLILFLTAVIWGVAFVAQSAGMEHLGPFTYNGVRSVLGGLVLIPCIVLLNRIQGRNGSEERDTDGRLQQNPAVDGTVHSKLSSCSTCRLAGRMAIHAVKVRDFHSNNRQLLTGGLCCGIILFAASNFQQFGIQYTTVGKAGFITAMYILIVPVLGLLFHKKAGLQVWIGVLFGVTGLYLLCMQDSLRLDRGDALVLVCAFIFSLHILVIDHFSQKVDGVKMSCIQFWVCGILSLLCSVLFESPDLHSIVISWLPVCYGGIMSCGVAYFFPESSGSLCGLHAADRRAEGNESDGGIVDPEPGIRGIGYRRVFAVGAGYESQGVIRLSDDADGDYFCTITGQEERHIGRKIKI